MILPHLRRFLGFPFLLVLLTVAPPAWSAPEDAAAGLVHLLGYIGVDYPETVSQGKVTDAGEYAEQREFAGRVRVLLQSLPATPEKAGLLKQADELSRRIERKAPGEQVSALTEQMRSQLIQAYRVAVAPRAAPDPKQGAKLYMAQCASCHGFTGRGDGLAARGMEPAPVNFHDPARQAQRSVYALYNAITLGVQGTAMQAYSATLSEAERWALAFHVANYLASNAEREQGATLWAQERFRTHFSTLSRVTNTSPRQAAAEFGAEGTAVLAYLRQDARAVTGRESPMRYSARVLAESFERYRAGKPGEAYNLAVSAYLEGFELAEAGLAVVSPPLKQRIEQEMLAYRDMLRAGAPVAEVQTAQERIVLLLQEARELLDGASLSPAMAYTSSLIILLREGLEAILLLAVVVAFLVKTGRREALPFIHVGWVVALLLGVATWFVAAYVVDISGASRELTEGVTALLAAAILLYVGFWLHSKLQAQRWKEFIETKVQGALNTGTLWSIALVAFIAVYREVFETVLFYQTLWVQAGEPGRHLVLAGFLSAALALVVLAWLIFKFSVRLPLRLFFGVNSLLLYLLAVVFAGKGIAALQEAGLMPVSSIRFPTIDVLGVYPNLQSLGLQVLLLVAAGVFVVYNRRRAA